ncbi:hypothetical protein FJR45_01320 [Sulfurimonas sediminis]|uniref:Sulfotransferase family protein n=1 Tax=Sulfurimonas sediminis TaxID=2590020 RepID=A0A7M1AYY9_9BACT|nr:hypothetical protein [Sulfurimonas sediminis]QOP42661.1 hypothetical protein FJR45_01320 [Sulfurimonas sediminis]
MVERKKELCILHIGMPKTGSSTIQENLFQGVKDERVSYTDLSIANQSGPLYGLFKKNPENYHFFKNKKFTENDIKEFRKKTKKQLKNNFIDFSTDINILSGEDLYHSSHDEIKQMKNFLKKFFHKTLVIVYVRPVYSFCNSAFQQLVKNHELNSFDFKKIYHKYKNLENYDKAYGKKNVSVVPFVPKKFLKNDLLFDFCSHVGIEKQFAAIKTTNESLSKEAVAVLFTFNFHKNAKTDFGHRNILIQHKVTEILKNFGNEKFQFSGKLIQSIIDKHFKEDYAWLLNRIPDEYSEDFLFDSNKKGVETENELMEYATNFIDELTTLIDQQLIDFPLEKTPQTVAKLVNILRTQIAKEMD